MLFYVVVYGHLVEKLSRELQTDLVKLITWKKWKKKKLVIVNLEYTRNIFPVKSFCDKQIDDVFCKVLHDILPKSSIYSNDKFRWFYKCETIQKPNFSKKKLTSPEVLYIYDRYKYKIRDLCKSIITSNKVTIIDYANYKTKIGGLIWNALYKKSEI